MVNKTPTVGTNKKGYINPVPPGKPRETSTGINLLFLNFACADGGNLCTYLIYFLQIVFVCALVALACASPVPEPAPAPKPGYLAAAPLFASPLAYSSTYSYTRPSYYGAYPYAAPYYNYGKFVR